MPAELYAPGKPLPPHLSPFVDNEEEGYVPDIAREVARLQVRGACGRVVCAGACLCGR